MQHMKTGMVATLMLFSFLALSGCTTTYLDLKSWEGRTLNDLYFEWGKPDDIEITKDNRTAYTWHFEREVDGKAVTCKKYFYTRNTGNEEVIVDTYYKDCLFLTAQ